MPTATLNERPAPPYVVVTRKGGFPAIDVSEARRLLAGHLDDPRVSVTDARGRHFTPRTFLDTAPDLALDPIAPSNKPEDVRSWASSTADIDLDGAPPPGWMPPAKTPTPVPASTGTGSQHRRAPERNPPARTRSDRDDAIAPPNHTPMLLGMLAIVGVGLCVVVVFALRAKPTPAVPTSTMPAPHHAVPTPTLPALPADDTGTVDPSQRPLPSFMR